MNYMDLEVDPLGFRGYGEYAIRQFDEVWTWYDAVTGTNFAKYIPEKGQINYPFGRHVWNLTVRCNFTIYIQEKN